MRLDRRSKAGPAALPSESFMSESSDKNWPLRPDDVPFDPVMSDNDVRRLAEHEIFDFVESKDRRSKLLPVLKLHSREIRCKPGDVLLREGDWGNTAYLILDGEVAIEVEGSSKSLSAFFPQRGEAKKNSVFGAIAQFWRNSRIQEHRDSPGDTSAESIATRQDEAGTTHLFIQDVPAVLDVCDCTTLKRGQMFGELAALGRTARTASAFAVEEARLLEIRWQGLRKLLKVPGFKARVDDLFRSNALKSFLEASPLFGHLADDDQVMDELVRESKLVQFGEYDRVATYKKLSEESATIQLSQEPLIANQGDYANGVFLIRNGVARVTRFIHGAERTISYLTAGKVFGFEEIERHHRENKDAPYRSSLRAIGYLTAIFISSPLVVKHLLQKGEDFYPKWRQRRRAMTTLPGAKRFIDQDLIEFLLREGITNGTASMLIDLDRCTRCDDCVRACASAHDNNPRFVRHGPIHGNIMVAQACMHCQDPVCMIECPTGAIGRELAAGEVTIDDKTCIGCSNCAKNCPYDAIQVLEIRDDHGELYRKPDNKPVYKATKCDLCVEQFGGPACQRACPHDALVRMDMTDGDTVSRWLR